eukprot:CAMPEP_0197025968 /NCGR_PEP_ID=MMETSP1384-20130603/6169_1 /TAXON_ID=29189 /ORGANISM="Ammonia sp." /LENGTH=258 /DNA_ID=CAMNT_0042454567 /DNA_START=53 /DNA_END=829 /DNA_ORIENTATION=-
MSGDNNDESSVMFYISMFGLYGVGKTAIINKLQKNVFQKSYKPTEDKKIMKYTVKENTIRDLQASSVKISFKDSAGFSSSNLMDDNILARKAHILCFVYDHDNEDSYQCVLNLLQSNDRIFSSNCIVMVIRNKVDNKTIIADTEETCNQQFKEITAINEEIIFIKNFSAKTKTDDKIEKVFMKAINQYRDYYGEQPPVGGAKKRTTSKAVAYDKSHGDDTKANSKQSGKQKQSKEGRTKSQSNEAAVAPQSGCACIIL